MSGPPGAPKAYNQRYFERWYRGRGAVATPAELSRRVRLALAAAEFVLERPVRSVLDVGCGEGRWRAPLVRARKGLRYVGVDGSDWAVRRWGRVRGIRKGSFGEVGALGLRGPFDLVVCADVVHYVPTPELRRGLAALAELTGGLLWLEAFTTDDDFEGDKDRWQPRSAADYAGLLKRAGFAPCGLNGWVTAERAARLTALERLR